MTVKHMRIFVKVYQTLNITKAADLLHMTQPAVTRSIQEIEHYYGVHLFERISHKLYVTEVGKSLYQQALHIVYSFDTLEKGLYNWDSFGILRIGASITIGNTLLSQLIVDYKKQFPYVHIKTMILNTESLINAIKNNELDIALIETSVNDVDLKTKTFFGDNLVLITPINHPLLSMKSVKLADLLDYDLLLREEGSAVRTLLDNTFLSKGINLVPSSESISTHAIIRLVETGLGISLLPKELVAKDIQRGKIATKEIDDAQFEREYKIVWHRNKFLSNMITSFIKHCEGVQLNDDEQI